MMNQFLSVHVQRKLFTFLGAALMMAGPTFNSYAATLTWTNTTGGVFSDAVNWSPAQAPAGGDEIRFTNNSTYTVTFNANTPLLGTTDVNSAAGTITFNVGTSIWSVTNSLRVGWSPNATGTVYLAGGTLSIINGDNNAQLRVGDASNGVDVAHGVMFITNGTVVADIINVGTTTNATGKLVVTGQGKIIPNEGGSITIGGTGARFSELIVTNGGSILALGEIRIGTTSSSSNLAVFSGSNSSWTNLATFGVRVGAGQSRGNRLIVTNGAKLYTANGATIGGNGGSAFNTGIVVGVGSELITPGNNPNTIAVGTNSGGSTNNHLRVYDGARLSVSDGTISVGNDASAVSNSFQLGGTGAISTGTVRLVRFAQNSQFNSIVVTNGYLRAEYMDMQGASNSLSVLAGGRVTLTNSFAVAAFVNSSNNVIVNGAGAFLLIDGGTITSLSGSNAFGIIVGNNATLHGASMTIRNGGKLFTERGTIGGGGSGYVTGIVAGAGSLWSNEILVSPATPTNLLIVGTNTGGNSNNLSINNGGVVINTGILLIGNSSTSSVNSVNVGGIGAIGALYNDYTITIGASAGQFNFGNRLTVSNGYLSAGSIFVGATTTNVGVIASHDNVFEILGGTVDAGVVRVRGTNNIVFRAGTLNVGGITVDNFANNGLPTVIGDGVNVATLRTGIGSSNDFNLGGLLITNNAAFEGYGTISGVVTNYGKFTPGTPSLSTVLTLTSHLQFMPSATLEFNVGTVGDRVDVGGSLGLGGTLNITAASGGGFGTGSFTLFTYVGTLTGNGTLTVGTTPNGSLTYVIDTNTLGLVVLNITGGGGGGPFDTWRTAYFPGGGPNAAAGADPDGDGLTNTNEFLAGFNPTNSAAYPQITSITRTANTNLTITYLGSNGDTSYSGGPSSRTNVLEFTTGGVGGSFSNLLFVSTGMTNILSGGIGNGQNATFIHTNGASGGSKYYRVRVVVP